MKVKEEVKWKCGKIKTDWDRPSRSLNCLYWLKTSRGEKVWLGAMTTATLVEQTLTALEVHTLTWFSQMKLAAVQTAISSCPEELLQGVVIKDSLCESESSSVGTSSADVSVEGERQLQQRARLAQNSHATVNKIKWHICHRSSDGCAVEFPSVSSRVYSKLTLGGDGQYCIVVSIITLSHRVEGIDREVVGGGGLQAGDSEGCRSGRKDVHVEETGQLIPTVSVDQRLLSSTGHWLWKGVILKDIKEEYLVNMKRKKVTLRYYSQLDIGAGCRFAVSSICCHILKKTTN